MIQSVNCPITQTNKQWINENCYWFIRSHLVVGIFIEMCTSKCISGDTSACKKYICSGIIHHQKSSSQMYKSGWSRSATNVLVDISVKWSHRDCIKWQIIVINFGLTSYTTSPVPISCLLAQLGISKGYFNLAYTGVTCINHDHQRQQKTNSMNASQNMSY